ncbi:MAG: hypothetical protein ABF966_10595 [Bifidobacterium psychraerophilum]|uniref:hypothetical protein n=1 Tax=Bifidobacterium psychraerophilum TaxID=218140 RepID=UPI0039EC4EEF
MSDTNANDVIDTPQEVFNLLPAWARQAIYVVVVLVGVASAVYLSVLGYLDVSAPSWYGAATAGWVTLTGAFGLVAASNTSKQVTAATPTTVVNTVVAESNPPTVAAVTQPDVAVTETVPDVSNEDLAAAEQLAVANTTTAA